MLPFAFSSFYTSVDCVALPAPSASSDALQRLDLLPLSEMTPLYKSQFQRFKDKLLKRVANNYKVKNTLFHPGSRKGRTSEEEGRGRDAAGGRLDSDGVVKVVSNNKARRSSSSSSCARRTRQASRHQGDTTPADGEPSDRDKNSSGGGGRKGEEEEEEAGREEQDWKCESESEDDGGEEEASRQSRGAGEEEEEEFAGKRKRRREEKGESGAYQGLGVGKVPMSGKDVAALLKFLVRAANLNMFEDIQIFMNHFSTVRVRLGRVRKNQSRIDRTTAGRLRLFLVPESANTPI